MMNTINQIIDKMPIHELKSLLIYLIETNSREDKIKMESIIDQHITSNMPDIEPDELDEILLDQLLSVRTQKSRTRILNNVFKKRTNIIKHLLDRNLLTDAFYYACHFLIFLDYLYYDLKIVNKKFISHLKSLTFKVIENYMKHLDSVGRIPYYQYLIEALSRFCILEISTICEELFNIVIINNWEYEVFNYMTPIVEAFKDKDPKYVTSKEINILLLYSDLLIALPETTEDDIMDFIENFCLYLL